MRWLGAALWLGACLVALGSACGRSDVLEPRQSSSGSTSGWIWNGFFHDTGSGGGGWQLSPSSSSGSSGSSSSGSSSSSASSSGSSSSGSVTDAGGQCPNYVKPDVATGADCPENLPLLCSGTIGHPIACEAGSCPPGFTCQAEDDVCQLNGSLSPLQVTLSWDTPEDFDLHVIEPVGGERDGNGCEIWYGNTGNRPDGSGTESICAPQGWLDRDSNPACGLDDIDIENVLYAPGSQPPIGVYVVRADFYEDCAGLENLDGGTVPDYSVMSYAVQIRANGLEFTACGSFSPLNVDTGGMGSGVTMAAFKCRRR